MPENVLQTVLIEVEGILNSKPLGYVSSDVADLDPVTPNMLLMGWRDASLPQVIYVVQASLAAFSDYRRPLLVLLHTILPPGSPDSPEVALGNSRSNCKTRWS